jgi:nicotinate-nucleotide pyrophosphorylase (carboxylating)
MLDPMLVEKLIDNALLEDIGMVDLTSELAVPAEAKADFAINTRQEIVVAGIDVAAAVFRRRVPDCQFEKKVSDGQTIAKGTLMARVTGQARGLLTAERTALNLLQHMSAIATVTAAYVAKIKGTKATLIDTRKTTPGLRVLEKHAVQLGGGRNHRLDLSSGVMIKDNHISVCGSIAAAVKRVKAAVPVLTKVEVECDRVDQVREALDAGADMLLLDNMTLDMLRESVAIVAGRIPLEASGGVNFETIRPIAETGVDFISVGRITQSAPSVDIGLDASLSV